MTDSALRPTDLPSPAVRLVPRTAPDTHRERASDLPETGRWRVTGPAGSGVTSFVVDTVLQKIRAGADPDGILVLAASKESGARLRRELVDGLIASGHDYVSQAPLVRSVHSLAFALLRTVSPRPIRMITGAEQDDVIQQLLAGQAEDGRGNWPPEVRPALTYVGFARQLRDLLLRAAERGITGADLEQLGNTYHRPMWKAAGQFQQEYNDVFAIAEIDNYSASELVSRVLLTNAPDHTSWHTVVVDDAQHLDPKSAELVERILPKDSSGLSVVAGDPEQSIFRFRGASPAWLENFEPDPGCDVTFARTRRMPHRQVTVVGSESTQRDLIADTVRRAHLEGEVAWSDIAVIVRSTGQLGPVRRALLAAGVPVHINPTDVVLAEQRLVSAILLGIRALEQPLDLSEWQSLILGPVGGADPVTLRRLLRGLRRYDPESRSMDTLASLLAPGALLPDFGDALTERETHILTRLRAVLDAGRTAMAQGGSVEEVLWEVWHATDLANRLMAAALRGGATGSQADRDLDAMMALFDAAGDFAERQPEAGIQRFVDFIQDQELPTGVRDRRTAVPDAVVLLTAHGAVGREFDTVVVTGVQEGQWPSLGETGSLFEQEDFLDLVDDNIHPDTIVSHAADRLAEERRLFHVATTRATRLLHVVAVDDLDGNEPLEVSRFVAEFGRDHDIEIADYSAPATADGDIEQLKVRILSTSSLVAELRRVVCDPQTSAVDHAQAARQLARLAAEGVPGAHPDQWWGLTEPSTSTPLPGSTSLSPSRIEGLLNCPLREIVGKFDDEEEKPLAMTQGTLVHAYFEALGRGVSQELAKSLTMEAYTEILNEPQWRLPGLTSSFERLLDRTATWLASSQATRQQVGVEVPLNVEVIDGVRINGRMDRLEADDNDRAYIVDLKTGKTAPTKQDTQDNPQLAAYQLALSRGTWRDGRVVTATPDDPPIEVEQAVLVYPATERQSITTSEQTARSEEEHEEFAAQLPGLVAELAGASVTARVNDTCDNCPVRMICPVQPEGKMIHHG